MADSLEQLLLKYRKGTTAAFTAKTWAQLFEGVGGWRMEKVLYPAEIRLHTAAERIMRDLGFDAKLVSYGPGENKYNAYQPYISVDLRGNERAETLQLIHGQRVNLAQWAKANPLKMKRGAAGIDKIGEVHNFDWVYAGHGSPFVGFPFRLLYVVEAQKVTAPNGEFCFWFKPPYSSGMSHDLHAWTKERGLEKTVLEKLGLEEHNPRAARDWKNTGTCPVCFANQKLRGGSLVLHGYRRPRWGYTVGSCLGVNRTCVEQSVEGSRTYLEKDLKPALVSARETLRRLKAGEVKGFKKLKRGASRASTRDEDYTIVKAGDPDFRWALDEAIREAEHNVKSGEAEVKVFTAVVKEWKGPYPAAETRFGLPPEYFRTLKIGEWD